jgi:hypothetical protein
MTVLQNVLIKDGVLSMKQEHIGKDRSNGEKYDTL